jgi:hypothetical protein
MCLLLSACVIRTVMLFFPLHSVLYLHAPQYCRFAYELFICGREFLDPGQFELSSENTTITKLVNSVPPTGRLAMNWHFTRHILFIKSVHVILVTRCLWKFVTPNLAYPHTFLTGARDVAVEWGASLQAGISGGVIGIFYWRNPSGRPMALGSTRPLTDMNTKDVCLGVKADGA